MRRQPREESPLDSCGLNQAGKCGRNLPGTEPEKARVVKAEVQAGGAPKSAPSHPGLPTLVLIPHPLGHWESRLQWGRICLLPAGCFCSTVLWPRPFAEKVCGDLQEGGQLLGESCSGKGVRPVLGRLRQKEGKCEPSQRSSVRLLLRKEKKTGCPGSLPSEKGTLGGFAGHESSGNHLSIRGSLL